MKHLAFALLVLSASRVASAYPQFQLSGDQTCTGCHISPAGGGLLNENGLAYIEAQSTFGGKPEAAHGALAGPTWLLVSGDFRGAGGFVQSRSGNAAGFPMQADLIGDVHASAFRVNASLGFQMGDGNRPATFILSREHWVMWQQKPGENYGVFVRAGRFMPVFGLRLAEHNASVRRWGQTPLYGETYGASVADVQPGWEVHVTGFAHDPVQYSVERGNGVAGYGEKRFAERYAIGAEGRYAKSPEDARSTGGVIGKAWFPSLGVLLQAEAQFTHQSFTAGSARDQIVSYLMTSWFVHEGWLVDVGLSQYDEDIGVKHLDTEALDVNLHWFATSHWELLLTNRVQTIAFGSGGPTSGYVLVQGHYRL